MFLYFLRLVIVACALYGMGRFCHSKTKGFAIGRIHAAMITLPDLKPTSALTLSRITSILQQPFYYLAKGAQVYAFASADGQYVIKFLRVDPLAPFPWIRWIRFPLRQDKSLLEKVIKKRVRLYDSFNSYRLALDIMPEQTGLLYMHSNAQELRGVTLTLRDNLGILYYLDASTIPFVIQKRAVLIYPKLEQLLKQGDFTSAQTALSHLIHLIKARDMHGIWDKDPKLRTNFGFLGEEAIQIDPGRFCLNQGPRSAQDTKEKMLHITEELHHFLQNRSPTLAQYLSQEIEHLCAQD